MRRNRNRRGIAMLLVIMAVMMATILTTAYLASRNNSAAIGDNVASSAAARWAAMSGVQMGVAVMETEEDWTTQGGVLLDHVSLAGADVSVEVLDMATGLAPTEDTSHLTMTSTAIVDGVTQVATATAEILPTGNTVDVDLSEFVMFAESTITVDSSATIATWPASPLAKLGQPLNIATQSLAPNAIQIKDTAGAVNGKVYARPGSSPSVASVTSGPGVNTVVTPDPIPLPAPPDTGVLLPNRLLPPPDKTYAGTTSLSSTVRYKKVTLDQNSTTRLQGPMTLVADDDLELKQSAKMLVDGEVKIVVFDELKLAESAIEVTPGSRLEMFVRGGIVTVDSYIGDRRVDSTRRVDGSAPKESNLEKIQLWGITPVSGPKPWYFDGDTVVKASLYHPYGPVQIRNSAAVYGRVAAKQILVTSNATIYYDPALNDRQGYTNLDSAIYDGSGRMKGGFSGLTSLSTLSLTLVSVLTGTVVEVLDTVIGTLLNPAPPVVPVSQPTPRTVPVEFSLTSFGSETEQWEADSQ
jgi:hypothetical protein